VTELVANLGELALNLLGLMGVIALTLIVVYAGFNALGRLIWRLQRERIGICAEHIAAHLSLTSAPPPDPRTQLWRGRTQTCELWLTTGSMYYGPTGFQLDSCGPGFIDGLPQFSFEHLGSLLVVARFLEPLPVRFTMSTMYAVTANIETGDRRFDQVFKLKAERADNKDHIKQITQMFASAPLRDALLAIFGPDRSRDGTGIMIAVNECGLMAYWDSPKPDRAADFSRAVADAIDKIAGQNSGH
jgi:hypothetical protein